MNIKSLWKGFIVGGLISAVATILTAPSSSETRKRLKSCTKNIQAPLQANKISLHEVKESISSGTKESTDAISTFLEEIKSLLTKWKKEIEPHQKNLQKEIHSIQLTIEQLQEKIQQEPNK